jgi:hypothetical protein
MGAALDLACALDPVLLAERAGYPALDDRQRRLLRSAALRVQVNITRQGGKSTMAALLACHEALYVPGSLTLILARAQRQSSELFRKVLAIYRTLGRPVPAEAETALTLELAGTGSRIVALPGKEGTIRSYSGVALLVIDEASRVPDDSYLSVRPMLAVSGGRLLALSTPFGTRGWWYDAWVGSEPWERYEVPAEQCPRIPPAFLAEEKRTLGDWWFQQEYGCRFLDAQSAVFRAADIARMFRSIETWDL